MKELKDRLATVSAHINEDKSYTVMIIGLGSVGAYLLDYLVSSGDADMRIVVVGRDRGKLEESVNIARVGGLIREQSLTHIEIADGVDLNDIEAIRQVIDSVRPDFIVNSSRAYPGLKYGSISWTNFRAYGIWTPLAIRFTKNIMQATDMSDSDAIVINTSYSDAVIAWLKSAKKPYPDFGSGNLNHLVPRIRYAVAEMMDVADYENVEVNFAAGHFHDVVISKEGHSEGVKLPLKISYHGDVIDDISADEIYKKCKIAMPTDARRNQMNASSDFRIIKAIVDVCRDNNKNLCERLFVPGAFGNIGGYPVMVGYRDGDIDAWIDESDFSYDTMYEANRKSMYLDGIEDVSEGAIIYTDELIDKVRDRFGMSLPKRVLYDEIDEVANKIISEIIERA